MFLQQSIAMSFSFIYFWKRKISLLNHGLYAYVLGLPLVLCLAISGCSFHEKKAHATDDVPTKALVSAWAAKGEWLIADLRWHESMINQMQGDPSNQSIVETHQQLLDQRRKEFKALYKDMEWGSIRLRQVKKYELARAVETRMEHLTFQLKKGKDTLPKSQPQTQSTKASQNSAHRRESMLVALDEQVAKRNYPAVLDSVKTLTAAPYRQKKPDPRLVKAMQALQIEAEVLDRSASQAYRLGQVSDAIGLWEQALAYDPDNADIAQKLQRARRVADKLDAIRSSN